jgi:xanthine dehydrogenase accessory factor
MRNLVLVKGGGDLATGVAHRLCRSGFPVAMTEIARPTVIRRPVAFAEAVFDGCHEVEGITARLAAGLPEARAILDGGEIPVLIDPRAEAALQLKPAAVVDAIMAKRNTGTRITDALLVIGLGPGFTAGVDVHAVVETNRGHDLGRVILGGGAEPDTGTPGLIAGYGRERLIRAPADGVFESVAAIGSLVEAGETLGTVADCPVTAPIGGVLRGLIHDGVTVRRGQKMGDVDPRRRVEYCYTISDKARAIAGGVLEAVLMLGRIGPLASTGSLLQWGKAIPH